MTYIYWLETLAIEFLLYFLEALGYRDAHLQIYSDNDGAIGAHGKGQSGNFNINLSVRRTYSIISSILVLPDLIYIKSEDNPADPISRGDVGRLEDRLDCNIELPLELHPLFTHV